MRSVFIILAFVHALTGACDCNGGGQADKGGQANAPTPSAAKGAGAPEDGSPSGCRPGEPFQVLQQDTRVGFPTIARGARGVGLAFTRFERNGGADTEASPALAAVALDASGQARTEVVDVGAGRGGVLAAEQALLEGFVLFAPNPARRVRARLLAATGWPVARTPAIGPDPVTSPRLTAIVRPELVVVAWETEDEEVVAHTGAGLDDELTPVRARGHRPSLAPRGEATERARLGVVRAGELVSRTIDARGKMGEEHTIDVGGPALGARLVGPGKRDAVALRAARTDGASARAEAIVIRHGKRTAHWSLSDRRPVSTRLAAAHDADSGWRVTAVQLAAAEESDAGTDVELAIAGMRGEASFFERVPISRREGAPRPTLATTGNPEAPFLLVWNEADAIRALRLRCGGG